MGMDTRQLTRILIIGFGLYVFGLIVFLASNDANEDGVRSDNYEPIQGENPVSLPLSIKNPADSKNIGKTHIDRTNRELKTLNARKRKKDYSKNRKKRKHISEGKRQNDKKYYNKEYWDSLKNLTFKEKVDAVFGKNRFRMQLNIEHGRNKTQSSTNLLIGENGPIMHGYQEQHNKNDNQKQEHKEHLKNTTLINQNAGFLEVFQNVFVFSSFFDDRLEDNFVRNVIITTSGKGIYEKLWCHFWNPSLNSWQISELDFYETCESHLKRYSAYIASCKIPENTDYDYIYISNKRETNINEMRALTVVRHPPSIKHPDDLAVCVPPLFGNITSVRLIEFIEFSVILGYKHFTFYSHNVSVEILRILNHYQNQGLVTVIHWPLNIKDDLIWYHGQSAAVWDCLYRNMYMFRYVAFTDIDEFIFPRNTETAIDFIHKESERLGVVDPENTEICAYRFKSAYFDPMPSPVVSNIFDISDNIENNLVTLNSIDRKEVISEIRTKMIVDPIKIFELGIHHVSKPMQENYRVENVDENLALIHHYRSCQSNYGVRCYGKVSEDHALRYRNRLLTRMKWRFYHLSKEILTLR